MLPDPRHMGLTTMRTLFTGSFKWEKRGEQVSYGTPSKAYTKSVPDQQPLYPDGQVLLLEYRVMLRWTVLSYTLYQKCSAGPRFQDDKIPPTS